MTLPVVLVLSMTTALVMSVARIVSLPIARALGHGDGFARWESRATERLMQAAGWPLFLSGWIIGTRHQRNALSVSPHEVGRDLREVAELRRALSQ